MRWLCCGFCVVIHGLMPEYFHKLIFVICEILGHSHLKNRTILFFFSVSLFHPCYLSKAFAQQFNISNAYETDSFAFSSHRQRWIRCCENIYFGCVAHDSCDDNVSPLIEWNVSRCSSFSFYLFFFFGDFVYSAVMQQHFVFSHFE